MADPETELRTQLVDRYRIEGELGRGGMGRVYLAHDLKHDRPVALKVLSATPTMPLAPERFQREIRFAARLQHPHILPVHDSGETAGHLWFTMPYVKGETLRQRLRREHRLPLDDALRIAGDVAHALDYAHGQGLVHRDIKPENILLTTQGDSLVADFGIGRALAGGVEELQEGASQELLTGAGALVGTPAYMSLEQIDADPALDGRADIYSLGVVLYEMLAGTLPFAGSNPGAIVARQLTGPPRPLRLAREEVSPDLEGIVLRMLARDPQDRFATAGEVANVLEGVGRSGAAPQAPPIRLRRGRIAGVLATLGALAALGAGLTMRRSAAPVPELRASVVVVAPFDVFDPTLELWREGLVDLLSRNLDGAGPLRAVPPTVVVRRWTGRADSPSAAELGRRTGAGLALFGSLLGAGPDSARIRATLLDVTQDRTLGEWEVVDAVDRMDRLVDSLTLRVLGGLGRTRPIGAVRLAGLGATSLPALKAFLQGEQHHRRSEWDSALSWYQRAIELDSGFAPAFRRLGTTIAWMDTGFDSLGNAYVFHAGANNHGLPARDSLLIAAESVFASLLEAGPLAIRADTGWTSRRQRLFATLELATTRYPDDPEAWFLLGDAHSHLGAFGGGSYQQQLAAFDRAIALDSAYAPSYIHALQTSALFGPLAMRRYLRPYLALAPNDANGEAARLTQRLLDSTRGSADVIALGQGVPDAALIDAYAALTRLPDSAELSVALAQAISTQPRSIEPFNDSMFSKVAVARALMSRGRLREGGEFLEGRERNLFFGEAALLGAVPAERAAAIFRERLAGPANHHLVAAFPWWASRGDTASLRSAETHADSLARSESEPGSRGRARYVAASAAAYRALAIADTAVALERLVDLPDGACPACYLDRFTLAHLLVERRRDQEAWQLLRGEHPFSTLDPVPTEVLWALLRGRVGERLGERDRAIQSYTWVAGMWQNADASLQPYVREARNGLSRLTAEKPR